MRNIITIGILALYLMLKDNGKAKKSKGKLLIGQLNAPTGSIQAYSKVGTEVYNRNFKVLYKYDFAGGGMTITGKTLDAYDVVFGDNFDSGTPGWVFKKDVTI
jgi:hypothetical protein